MPLLAPLPRAADAVEMLDRPAPFDELCHCLDDVARLNGAFGGRLVTLASVKRLLRRLPADGPATVLDLGTGGADIPLALARWARRARRPLRIFALDRDEATLHAARRRLTGYPEIVLLQADALSLPLRPGSVDVALASLTVHHLEPEAAVACLAGMEQVARLGFVVNDLLRGRLGYALVWLATRVCGRSRMARHDGPLSVLRAYSAAELGALCAHAGIRSVTIRRYPPLARLCAVREKT